MTKLPTIDRRSWLAMWLQRRRRARARAAQPDDAPAPPAVPPAPVITVFEVIDDGNGNVDLNLTWTWDGLGWPDDGVFAVYVSSDDSHGELNAANVPGPGRTCSLPAILPAADIQYACRVVYVKDGTVGAFSDYAYGNPY